MKEWLIPRVLGATLIVFVLWLLYRQARWEFDECLQVGHSFSYCMVNNPIGAHTK